MGLGSPLTGVAGKLEASNAESFSFSDCSSTVISDSRSLRTSWRRMISCSRLCTERSFGLTRSDNDGRDLGESETELLVPWLDVDTLRDLAEDSSCESDKDCESDL